MVSSNAPITWAFCFQLNESQDEVDEQRRLVTNLKKKSVRLNQDMADLRLHLEEQIARNADLEKKQRK